MIGTSVALLLHLAGAIISWRRCRSIANPFTVVFVCLAAAAAAVLVAPLVPSKVWSEQIAKETDTYVGLMAVGMFGAAFYIRPISWSMGSLRCLSPIALKSTIVFATAIVVAGTVALYLNLGALPIQVMSSSFAAGRGIGYSDLQIPFVTPLTWACARLAFLLLAVDFLITGSSIRQHLRQNKIGYLLAILSTLLAVGSGMRNIMVWPVAMYLFGICRRHPISGWRLIASGVIGTLLILAFVLLGNFRVGGRGFEENVMSGMVKYEVSNPMLRSIATWATTYLGTGFYNLNAMIVSAPEPQHGLILISDIVPNVILDKFTDQQSEPAIDFLVGNGLLPYTGFTFRTIYADLYSDFGYWGSLSCGLLIFWLSIVLYNMSGKDPLYLLLYLGALPGLLMYPFLNIFTGLASLFPILVGCVVVIGCRTAGRNTKSFRLGAGV